MPLENPTINNNKEVARQAAPLFPTEFHSIDPKVKGTLVTEEDLILKDLAPKVQMSLYSMTGETMPMDYEGATKEEIEKFTGLLKNKIEQYSKCVELLKKLK